MKLIYYSRHIKLGGVDSNDSLPKLSPNEPSIMGFNQLLYESTGHNSINNKLHSDNDSVNIYTKTPFHLVVKTNLLMDLIATPHLGIEVYLGKNLSLSANWHYAWWKNDSRHRYWRTYGGDIGLRKWFGAKAKEKSLTGHHIGVYGQILTYDITRKERGYLDNKWTYGGGVEYGYSMPVTDRLNIDFTLGMGYLGGEYEVYTRIDDCYVWQATKNRRWIGPTKAEISIAWLLGRGNTNKTKGAKR